MEKTYKEQLSEHVENIFKRYSSPGLHICDIATGGGKSYTIGKLTCCYYPKDFNRIIILCVQNKLVNGMEREIDRFINCEDSMINPSEKLVIENNSEVISKAIKNGSFKKLLEEMRYEIDKIKDLDDKVANLTYALNNIRKIYEGLAGLIKTFDTNGKNEFIQNQIKDGESNLRRAVSFFFDSFKKHLERLGLLKKATLEAMLARFPSLVNVYPQVDYRRKRVLLMTIHKAMYGIDPILSEKIYLQDFAEKNKNTLILFDESDQAAIAMRNAIIDQSIDNAGGSKKFAKGYNGYLHYKSFVDNPNHISNEYYGNMLEECLKRAQTITNTNWKKTFGNVIPYKNIFLGGKEELESYRRGVFFSGPALKLNISQKNDQTHSYICYRKNDRHLSLVHAKEESQLKGNYEIVVPMDKFLSLTVGNTTSIKTQLRKVISTSLKNSKEKYNQEIKEINSNTSNSNHYLGYPTLEREIHTLFSRFEIPSEFQFEQQMYEFMTNRKNLFVGKDKNTKLPDYSIYSQGVQLYLEEIDERDNQHRVRLSCREISTTPEKILIDLVSLENTSVVLCSATASCRSVVSNFDIKYLTLTLGDKAFTLSKEERDTFDYLVDMTYPKEHQIEIVSLEKYEPEDKRENKIILPDKYHQLFSKEAIEEGLPEKWFRLTCRKLREDVKNENDKISFHLYRLFQFIEAYHWFIKHDDIHSMLFFQNRTGDKNKNQFHLISCLIDGSYKDQPSKLKDDLPTDWNNEHIRISKDWEEVETKILSKLSEEKDAKIMLVSAYGSFKAGANLQYDIPDGLGYVEGDNWQVEGEGKKKDWDAVYVQCPTSYLMMNEDGNESTFEKSLYNVMLTLMMLFERGCLSKADVAKWLLRAVSNNIMFNEPGVSKDKAAWAQTTVEQAIGRLCRTRNKPHTTYILFDESMKSYFDASNMEKSLTKEFRALADYILTHPNNIDSDENPDEIIKCNEANNAQSLLSRIRSIALRYTPHKDSEGDGYDDDYDDEGSIPYIVQASQMMYQSYKQTIIRKPVISSLEELDDIDKQLTFISKCYGDWNQDENGYYQFSCIKEPYIKMCPKGKGNTYSISPSSVRLDVLMKNPIIKEHFEKNGFATTWKEGGLILHPRILREDYAGEIGEEAFKAIVLHYTNCTEESFKHLEGRHYELADFVVCNPDGSYKIAFDVKNMNPKADHNDRPGDMPTTEKRKEKRERLKCELITVNMLPLKESGMDEIREIGGVIDEEGNIIQSAIEHIKNLIAGIEL